MNLLDEPTAINLVKCFLAGLELRMACRVTHLSRNTVRRWAGDFRQFCEWHHKLGVQLTIADAEWIAREIRSATKNAATVRHLDTPALSQS